MKEVEVENINQEDNISKFDILFNFCIKKSSKYILLSIIILSGNIKFK